MTTKHHKALRKILAVIGLAVMMLVFVPVPVYAQPAAGEIVGDQVTAQDLGLYYGEATGLGTADIRVTIARIIRIALSVLGIIAVVIVIAGGVVWMTAGGDEKKVLLAKKILMNGAIGLAIVVSAYAITSFVIKSLTEATTGVDEGGAAGEGGGFGGRGCANPPCAGNNFVAKISPKGQQRIQNVFVKIAFSERGRAVAYDPASLQLGDNIKIYKTDDRERAQVAVELVQANALELHLKPTGPCPAPNEAALECFEANTSYTVELTTTVKSNGGRSLYCPLAGDAFNCKRVFITGDQFDNDAPTVAIVNYQSGESVPLGGIAEIRVRARDAFGVDTLQYELNEQVVYASDAGGGTDVTDTFAWEVDENIYHAREAVTVRVHARDVDGHVTASEPVRLIPRPAHCFNRKQDADEVGPDCGGEFCGACAGAACRDNADCAAGVCRVPAGAEVGVCVELPVITDVNPPDGAPGTVVTIEGRYFGAQAGQVVFYKSPNEPVVAGAACGVQWSPDAITVSVPAGLEVNKVAAIGVRTATGDEDRTNDDRGAKFENVFTVNDVTRPGLCSIDPKSGLINDRVTVRGVNIGNGGASGLLFADQPARIDKWDQDRDDQLGEIVGFVPNIGAGAVRVTAQVGDKKSNVVPFEIRAFREQDRPNIGSVSPDRGPSGTYVTVAGTGFGAAGQGSVVVFEHRASGVKFFADMEFPPECGAGTWNDRLIVAKVPRDVDFDGVQNGIAPYKVQVKRGAAQVPSNAIDFGIAAAGQPAPGICKIDPNMRPVGGAIDLYGEHLGGQVGNVIFWDANATPDVATWTAADVRAVGTVWEETGRHVSIAVPAGAVSGPVKVVRLNDQAQSNGYDFIVGSCVQNRNQCQIAGQTCCQSGFYEGSCQESCAAGARTAEYSWIFSTGNIPLVPDLVECCGRNCPLANPLPSPSPWDGQANSQSVCVNALIRGTFTTNIADAGNPEDNFILEKCVGEGNNPCTDFAEVHTGAVIANGDGHAEFSFSGEHTPNLEPNATYQVRIAEGLIAMPDAEAGRDGGEMRADPAMVEACGGERHSRGTAYCFRFRTNDRECAIGGVGVVPGAFTAKELGFLVADDDNNVVPELTGDEDPLYRAGVTAAGNSCISLDPARFDWQWRESSRGEVARVLAAGRAGTFTRFIQAIKPSDTPVTISATAAGVTGSGTLLVSPGDPQIIAAWPQCQEACVNVDAGISFNIPMDAQSLSPLNVAVYKCRNELCKFEDIEADLGSGRIKNTIESIQYEDVNDAELPPHEKHRARFIFREQLAVAAFYRVVLDNDVRSRDGVTISKLSDDYDFPVEQDGQSILWKSFTFRVRNDDKPCAIQSVAIQPLEGTVRAIGSQKWFRASAQGEENGCGPNGGAELLNAANMSWAWTAAEPAVVGLETFDVSARPALGCTAQCLLVGSAPQARLCGNGRLDAGEDCDPANGTWCTGRCLFAGTEAPVCGNNEVNEGEQCDDGNVVAGDGCSEKCLAEGASATNVTCGNTDIAPGENCDDGNVRAGDGCSSDCIKEGTSISEAWCRAQGDGVLERYPACAQALASCGNGVLESGEACDPPAVGVCSARCLLAGGAGKATCGNGILEAQHGEECDDGNAVSGDGCENCLLRGSSPRYANASICGDGRMGTGESFKCESNQHGDGRPDPLVLATLQSIAGHEQELRGEGAAEARIETEIQAEASYNETTGTGSAKLVLQCGFTQADQCPDPDNYGVGSNGCCYAYPTIIESKPVGDGACRNPALSFKIDSGISSKSLEGNIWIAIERNEPCRDGEIEIAFGQQDIRLATQSWWERFVARVRRSVRHWFAEVVNAAPAEPARWCASTLQARYSTTVKKGKTKVQIMPSSLLEPNSRYRVIVKGGANGIHDGRDVPLKEDFEWRLSTGPHVCTLDEMRVEPSAWVFSTSQRGTGPICSVDADCGEGGICMDVAGGQKKCDLSQHRFVARAYTGVDENAREIAPVPNSYDWNVGWGPTNQDSILGVVGDANSALVSTKQGQSGDEIVIANATITTDKVNNPPQKDRVITGAASVKVSACERPWPALVGGPPIFPYEDVKRNNDGIGIAPAGTINIWTNFSTWYCMDAGEKGEAGDLPALTPQFIQYNRQGSPLIKQFHFLTPNNEAIGIMVRANPDWLSIADWYEREFPGQGKPRAVAPIDGFEAAQLGNTTYVSAVNYNKGALFSNIYIFSMSGVGVAARPSQALSTIFSNLVKNTTFTVNIAQYNRCAAENNQAPDMASPKCSADVECTDTWAGRQCLADRDKLRRDLTRMKDVQEVLNGLKNYKTQSGNFPLLNEGDNTVGSFVPFFTTSKWGSWQSALGNTLARRLPEDPVNKFVRCSGDDRYDAETCWNASTQTFQCKGGNVYQYRTVPDGAAAEVWMNFEFFDPARQRELGDRIDALADDGVSFRNGACVKGALSVGRVDVAQEAPAVCGNGVKEGVEACDDGPSNGRYGGYCNGACTATTGYCGDMVKQREEVCDSTVPIPVAPGVFNPDPGATWAQERDGSCGWDCQSYGLYCGDGVLTKSHSFIGIEFPAEACDDGNNVSGDGCSDKCKVEEIIQDCGNGKKEGTEQCDGGDRCDAQCRLIGAYCGNSFIDAGEVCDNGAQNGVACTGEYNRQCSYCSADCRTVRFASGLRCGDGLLQPQEVCDGAVIPADKRCVNTSTFVVAQVGRCNDVCSDFMCDANNDNTPDGDYVLCTPGQDCREATIRLTRVAGHPGDVFRAWFARAGSEYTMNASGAIGDGITFTRTLPRGEYKMKVEWVSSPRETFTIISNGQFVLQLPAGVSLSGEPSVYTSGWNGWRQNALFERWFLYDGEGWFYTWKGKKERGETILNFRPWLESCYESGPACNRADYSNITELEWTTLLTEAGKFDGRQTVFDRNTSQGAIYRDEAHSIGVPGFIEFTLLVQ